MARRPTLSPSKITTYLACPMRYRWTYMDERGKWYLKSKSCYSFGTTLHRVLERFHDSQQTGVETMHEVMAAYDESWLTAGFASAEEMAEVYGEGKQILERYVENATRQPASAKTLFVERMLKLDLQDFVLVGRIDRVDEHEDGTLEIIDYKSGRDSVTSEDVACDISMACYTALTRAAYPGRSVRATIVALRSGESASYTMPEEELDEFLFDIHELGRRILNHDYFEMEPVAKRLCHGCDFLPLCRRHHAFDYRPLDEAISVP